MSAARHPLVRRTVLVTLLRCAVAAAALLTPQVVPPAAERGSAVAQPDRPSMSRVERLVARHDCWTGDAPTGAEPTHAVVTLPGSGAERTSARTGFDIWLDGAPGVLHAFCP